MRLEPNGSYQSGGEGFFECFEGVSAFWSEVPSDSFSGQMREQNHDIRVVINEALVEIYES